MFKVIMIAISLVTGQPIGIGVSMDEYSTVETCNADILAKSTELQSMLQGRVPGGVKIESKCIPSASADALFAKPRSDK